VLEAEYRPVGHGLTGATRSLGFQPQSIERPAFACSIAGAAVASRLIATLLYFAAFE